MLSRLPVAAAIRRVVGRVGFFAYEATNVCKHGDRHRSSSDARRSSELICPSLKTHSPCVAVHAPTVPLASNDWLAAETHYLRIDSAQHTCAPLEAAEVLTHAQLMHKH